MTSKWKWAGLVVGAVGVSFATWVVLDHDRATALPAVTGPYAVGRVSYEWTDADRHDSFDGSGGPERLVAWIWYPAATSFTAPRASYLPPAWRDALTQHEGAFISKLINRDLARVRPQSFDDPPPASSGAPFPVVMLRAGGAALSTDYTVLAEDLASHGYVVVGLDAARRSWIVVDSKGAVTRVDAANLDLASDPDRLAARLMELWSSDIEYALARLQQLNQDAGAALYGHLDFNRIGVIGHSLGGATAAQFCHDDSRCRAGMDIDGDPFGSVVQEGLTQPFAIVLSDHGAEPASESGPVLAKLRSLYDHEPASGRLWVTVQGANHFSFTDSMLVRNQAMMDILRGFRIVPLDGRRGLALTRALTLAFLDAHLMGGASSELERVFAQYPEAHEGPP